MSESNRDNVFVRVKDNAGNEWVCPLDALKKSSDLSDEQLDSCVDDATVGRYLGDIKIVKK